MRYWLPPVVWACIILVGTSLPKLPGPQVGGFDKLLHGIAYGVLGLLVLRGFISGRGWTTGRAALWTWLLGGTFGALDEVHQAFIPGRSATVGDFVADLSGLIIAAAAIWIVRARTRDVEETHSETNNKEMNRMAEQVHVDAGTFEQEILQSDVPVLVDFWAPWCGPCLMMDPALESIAEEYDGTAKVAKVNVDENPELATNYGIRSIPALMFFSNGEVVEQVIGVQPEEVLKEKLDNLT